MRATLALNGLKSDMERSLGLLESLSTPKEVTRNRLKFDEASLLKYYGNIKDSRDTVSLSSGLNASKDVQKDLLRAKDVGQQKSVAFIEERQKQKKVAFYNQIKKKKKKKKSLTSLNLKKTLKIKDKDVIIRGDHDLFGRMLILQEKRGNRKSAHFTSPNFLIEAILHI